MNPARISLIIVSLILLHPSTALTDMVVSIAQSGSDTTIQMTGGLDATGTNTGLASISSQARLIVNTNSFFEPSTIISRGVNNVPSYLWDANAFQRFGNVTQNGFTGLPSDSSNFHVGFVDRNSGFDYVVVPSQFVSPTGGNVTHTIVGQSLLQLWGLAPGDSWGIEMPVLNALGEDTGASQTLTFQVVENISSVPEPSSLFLGSLLGAFALGARRRR